MEFMEVIRKRRSIRAFEDKDISEDALNTILEAARLAPSAKNRQLWKFIVVRDREKREKLAKAARNQMFIAQAPVVIAAVALDPEHIMTNGIPEYPVDLAIAVEHMALAACDQGLGSCWICAFDQEEVKKILEVPENCKVVALLPIGYPAEDPPPRPRKPLAEIVSFEKF